jgi:biopolymer transport protein TolR
MRSRVKQKRRPMSEINVVPYIDVMLVLLIIFMITTPMLSQGVQVNLPKAQAQTLSAKEKEPIVVSVDEKGLMYLNVSANPATPISAQDLAVQVAAQIQIAQQEGQKRLVLVKGDQSVGYGRVMQAMTILQKAGASSVGLVTENPPKTS